MPFPCPKCKTGDTTEIMREVDSKQNPIEWTLCCNNPKCDEGMFTIRKTGD